MRIATRNVLSVTTEGLFFIVGGHSSTIGPMGNCLFWMRKTDGNIKSTIADVWCAMTERLLFLGGLADGEIRRVDGRDRVQVDFCGFGSTEVQTYFRAKLEMGSDKRGWKTIEYMRPKGELIFPEDLIEHLMKGYGENDGT